MAILITPNNRHQFATLLDQYFQLRHKVYNIWLGWDLGDEDGREFDEFDNAETVYVLTLDHRGRVDGGGRLCPTTSPYMLSTTFKALWGDEKSPHDACVWEGSRFAVNWETHGRDRQKIHQISSSITAAIGEFCILNNIKEIVSVLTPEWEELVSEGFGKAIWRGEVQDMGASKAVAVRYAVNYEALRNARAKFNIPSPAIRQIEEIVHV